MKELQNFMEEWNWSTFVNGNYVGIWYIVNLWLEKLNNKDLSLFSCLNKYLRLKFQTYQNSSTFIENK